MNGFIKRILRKLFLYESGSLSKLNPKDRKIVTDIRQSKLTYLSVKRLVSIVDVCRLIEKEKLPGCFIETGCALGGSTILISKIKHQDRPLYVYDVFGMIPPPSDEDGEYVQKRYETIRQGKSNGIGRDKYYGYEENLYEKVQENLRKFNINEEQHNVSLFKGLLQDTMQIEQPVAFAHIDVDWYEPVKTCLERIIPNLVVGGSVILDDYQDWSGCRKATDEFFQDKSDNFRMDESAGSMKITKIKG